MKYLLSVILFCAIQKAFSQQSFQGTIVYNLKATGEKKEAELTAMFGVNKIKLKFKDKEDYDKEYILIDFDSGKLFNLNTLDKNYKSTILSSGDNEPAKPKIIAGYSTTPVQANSSGPLGMLSMLMSGSTTYYVANDLFFPLDPKYASNQNLIIINNNRIVLGATIKVRSPFGEGYDESDSAKMTITAEAVRIDKNVLPKEEFLIPQDYVRKKKNDFVWSDTTGIESDSTAVFDSTRATPDVLMEEVPVPPTKKPATKSGTKPTSPKKPVPKKGEATKPKKS